MKVRPVQRNQAARPDKPWTLCGGGRGKSSAGDAVAVSVGVVGGDAWQDFMSMRLFLRYPSRRFRDVFITIMLSKKQQRSLSTNNALSLSLFSQ